MERPEKDYIEYQRYQEFIAAKREALVDPLGQISLAAVVAPLGIPVSKYETVTHVRSVEHEPLSEKLSQPMGAVSVRKFFQNEQTQAPLDQRVFTGYGPETQRSDMTLAA